MGIVRLKDKAILKMTPVGGSTSAVSIIGGTEQPFDKLFSGDVQISGSLTQFAQNNDIPSFKAIQGTAQQDQAIPDTTFTAVKYGTELYDLGDNFFGTTAPFFKAPYRGTYYFHAEILYNGSTVLAAGDRIDLRFYLNGSVANTTMEMFDGTRTGFAWTSTSMTINLDKDDQIKVYAYQATGATINTYSTAAGSKWTNFSGCLIARTGN